MTDSGDFKENQAAADIVRMSVITSAKKAGAQNYPPVPDNEKTPSFSVHATRQFYHCFGCGVSGDVFSFVRRSNITFLKR
jgi:DNA primase